MTDSSTTPEHFIVVGIDGSRASMDALAWAGRQASLTGASLHVVMTWQLPTISYGTPMPAPVDLNMAAESRQVLDAAVAEILGPEPRLGVTTAVAEGHPAAELLRAAQHADLLVVGSRGHGAFAGMLLGSVSEHCVSHAACPVVVVRHEHQPAVVPSAEDVRRDPALTPSTTG